jgi:hypothetical protein
MLEQLQIIMIQLEIDSEVHQWFIAHQRVIDAEHELTTAQLAMEAVGKRVAHRLLPSDAKVGEFYIFPSTDSLSVRCSVKSKQVYYGDGTVGEILVPFVEKHDFNRK